jgi:hypothetical protein
MESGLRLSDNENYLRCEAVCFIESFFFKGGIGFNVYGVIKNPGQLENVFPQALVRNMKFAIC